MIRFLRLIAGLCLAPLCFSSTRAVVSLAEGIQPSWSGVFPPSALAMGGGFLVWIAIYLTLPRPVRSYILAHELTHALWAWLMGAEVSKISVSRRGGSVVVSKSNFLITLAPYFFPLYTVVVAAGYWALSLFFHMDRFYLYWLALIGFTWGFHFTFTISTLMQRQSDIREYGHVFSYAFIYLMNVLGMGLWLVAVSSARLDDFGAALSDHARETAVVLVEKAQVLWNAASAAYNK